MLCLERASQQNEKLALLCRMSASVYNSAGCWPAPFPQGNHEKRRSPLHFLISCGHMKFTFSCLFILNLFYEWFSIASPSQQHRREGELSIVRKKMCEIFSNLPAGQISPQAIISLNPAGTSTSWVSAYAVKGCCLFSINKIFLDFKSICMRECSIWWAQFWFFGFQGMRSSRVCCL